MAAELKTDRAYHNAVHDGSISNHSTLPINGNTDYNGYQASGAPINRAITPGGHPSDNSQPAFPVYHRKFANPAPLGLMSFGATTFLLSLYNVQARHITTPNVILGMALGYGGLAQFLAGIEEWACGNTFGATAFASFGSFWFSFATLYIPQFGVIDSFMVNGVLNEGELNSALGLYLCTWGIITFIFLIACLRSSVALVSLFFFLDLTFWLLAAGFLAPSVKATKAGGSIGILTSAIAGYTALAGMLTRDTSHFLIPVGNLSRGRQ